MPAVVCTGVPAASRKAAAALAPEPEFSVTVTSTAEPLKRTHKVLLAVAAGGWLVGEDWLAASTAAGAPVDPEPYELADRVPGCRISRLRGGARSFCGLRVAVVGSTSMPAEELCQLIRAGGGEVVAEGKVAGGRSTPGRPLLVQHAPTGPWKLHAEADLYDALTDGAGIQADAGCSAECSVRGGGDCAVHDGRAAEDPSASGSGAGAGTCEPPAHGEERTAAAPPPRSPRQLRRLGRGASSASSSSAAPGGGAVPLSLVADSSARVARLLPAQLSDETEYFDADEALKLYRHRLPECNVMLPAAGQAAGRGGRGGQRAAKRGRERDFLHELVFEADGARTAVLRPANGAGDAMLAACTFVHHRAEGLCELWLLAVRQSRRGLGSVLLGAVEAWMRDQGVRCVVCLAGEDTVDFWGRHGYAAEHVTLRPEWWAMLADPFGGSHMVAKWF